MWTNINSMLNAEQLPAIHETQTLLEMMLRARWLKSFMFTDGEGWQLVWTAGGAQRVFLLKAIIGSYDLDDDDHAPVAFTILAQSDNFTDAAEIVHADVLAFWRQCSVEIGLRATIEDCLAFVRIISAEQTALVYCQPGQ
jgi:hypothetical protein